MKMIDVEKLATYYTETDFSHHEPLKHEFRNIEIEKLTQAKEDRYTILQGERNLDPVFLFEAKTFFRLSIFNLLAYKHLVCGNYVPASQVILYYSYFYSISCLLRLAGKAAIHSKEIPKSVFESNPKLQSVKFQLTRKKDSHDYVMSGLKKNEHTFVWDVFSEYFPNMLDKEIGRMFIEDRYRWNYDLFYPSHSTEDFVLREAKDRCNYNFIDPELGKDFDDGAAEDLQDKIGQFGYEEGYAGQLIMKCVNVFKEIGKNSKYRNDYVGFFNTVCNEMELFTSKTITKEEVKKWINKAIEELD